MVPSIEEGGAIGAQLEGFFLIVHQPDEEVPCAGDFFFGPAESAAVVKNRDVDIDAVEVAAWGFGSEDVLDAEIGFLEGAGGGEGR